MHTLTNTSLAGDDIETNVLRRGQERSPQCGQVDLGLAEMLLIMYVGKKSEEPGGHTTVQIDSLG